MIRPQPRLKPLLFGMLTHIPGMANFRYLQTGTGGTSKSRYCYTVWLRHLKLCAETVPNFSFPKHIAELGPGDSLGIGLAALISGVEHYYAFDVIAYSDLEKNLVIFDELVELFKNTAALPDNEEFPRVKPFLKNYDFPKILDSAHLENALAPQRLKRIRDSLIEVNSKSSVIHYCAPWSDSKLVRESSLDLIYSQAVLEHVDDLDSTYLSMYKWLKDGGVVSHQVDFKCHGLATTWDGHWAIPEWQWKIIRGKRPYLINRSPVSDHRNYLTKYGFKSLKEISVEETSSIDRSQLASAFQNFSDEDLKTSGCYFLSQKSTRA